MTKRDGIDWRFALPNEDRNTLIKYISEKLQFYAPNLPEATLKEHARQYEDAAFIAGATRQDYLTRLASALNKIEAESTNQSNVNQQSQNIQGQPSSSSSSSTTNDEKLNTLATILTEIQNNSNRLSDSVLNSQNSHRQSYNTNFREQKGDILAAFSNIERAFRRHSNNNNVQSTSNLDATTDSSQDCFTHVQQDGTNWRSVVSTEDRLTVIKHIFRKLQTYAPDLPEETLQERTRQFEDAAFRTASNRQHYLTHIAAALSKIEVASGSQSNSTQQPANVQSQPTSENIQQQHIGTQDHLAHSQEENDMDTNQEDQQMDNVLESTSNVPSQQQNLTTTEIENESSPSLSCTGNMSRTSAAGSSAVAANITTISDTRPPTVNGKDAEFWKKLKDMQMKYKQPLERLYPYLLQLQSQPGNNNTATLVKHVGECMKILNLSPKGQQLSQNVTIEVLERAEKFINRVIGTYRNFSSARQ